MDPLILLQHARDAGLRIGVAGTSLKISGPRKAEPLVRLLAEHKAQVLDALRKVQEVQKVQGTESLLTSIECDPGPFASAHAEAFGWTERDLFGLPDVPDRPRPKYQRLSRYDQPRHAAAIGGCRCLGLSGWLHDRQWITARRGEGPACDRARSRQGLHHARAH